MSQVFDPNCITIPIIIKLIENQKSWFRSVFCIPKYQSLIPSYVIRHTACDCVDWMINRCPVNFNLQQILDITRKSEVPVFDPLLVCELLNLQKRGDLRSQIVMSSLKNLISCNYYDVILQNHRAFDDTEETSFYQQSRLLLHLNFYQNQRQRLVQLLAYHKSSMECRYRNFREELEEALFE